MGEKPEEIRSLQRLIPATVLWTSPAVFTNAPQVSPMERYRLFPDPECGNRPAAAAEAVTAWSQARISVINAANLLKPCAASVSAHSRVVLGGLRRLSRIRINATTTLSGELTSRRHKKTSGPSATTPAFASSSRLKCLRFQVMIVTISVPARLRAATAAAAT